MEVLGGLGTGVPGLGVVVLHTADEQVVYGLDLVQLGGLVHRRAYGDEHHTYDYIQRQEYNSDKYEKLVIRAFSGFQKLSPHTK